MATQTNTTPLKHLCEPVIHPITSEYITNYNKLAKDPATREVWTTAFGKEWGNLSEGYHRTGTKGKNSLFAIDHKEIRRIPVERTVTYANIVVGYCPQKADPNPFIIIAGGNLVDYSGELTTRTADITTSKILWNSIISTINTKNMFVDIKNLPLHTTRPTGIHVHTIVRVPVTHHKPVQLNREGTE